MAPKVAAAKKKAAKAEPAEPAEPVVEEPQICYVELLSDELQSRILGWLPLIMRIRIRTVCRKWNTLATAQPVNPTQPCLLLACNYWDPHWKMGTAMFIFDPSNSSWSNFKVPDAMDSTTVRLCRSAAGTSGLVVFRGKTDQGKQWEPTYWVGNPMTNKWREIPCPKEVEAHNESIICEEIVWNDKKQLYELLVFKVRSLFSGLCRWVTYRYNWRTLKWDQGNWKKQAVEFKEVHASCVERGMVYFLQEAPPHPKKGTVKRVQIIGYDVEEDEYRVIYPPAEFVCPKSAEFTSAKFELFVSKQLGNLKHPRMEFVATIQMDAPPPEKAAEPAEGDQEADGANSETSSVGSKSNSKKGDVKKGDSKPDAKKGDSKADAKKGNGKADAKKGDSKKGDAKVDIKKGDGKADPKKGDVKKGDDKAEAKKGDTKADGKKGDAGKKDAKGDKKADGKGKKGKVEEEVVEEEPVEEIPEPPPGPPRRFCVMRYNPDEGAWTSADKTHIKMEDCFSRECNFVLMATGGPRMCYIGCRSLLNEFVVYDADDKVQQIQSQWSRLPKPFDLLQEPPELKKWYHSAVTPFFPRFDVIPGDFTYGRRKRSLELLQHPVSKFRPGMFM